MAFRLPRLREEKIVGDNPATPLFRRWWESVVKQLESSINSITTILDGLTGVEGSITGLQAQADILDNISDLTGTGLIEKIGASAVAMREIGVGAASAIPTRLDADNRYLKPGTPAASTATVTHSVAVDIGGTTYYVILSNVP